MSKKTIMVKAPYFLSNEEKAKNPSWMEDYTEAVFALASRQAVEKIKARKKAEQEAQEKQNSK